MAMRLADKTFSEPYKRFTIGRWEIWLYSGRSFDLERRVQRMRIGRDCGFWQIAYGSVRHYGLPAKRTLGLQVNRCH